MIDAKIETLLTVCELKNFTKTAKKLALTQPAVSQHIKQLEKEYDIKLFNRSENGIELTQEGLILEKYARRIKSLNENLKQEIMDEKTNIKRLIIGVTPSAESNIIS